MPFQDSLQARADVHAKLAAYMAGPPRRGAVAVAGDIARNADLLGGAVSHDTIKRCEQGAARSERTFRVVYNFLVLRGRIFDPELELSEQAAGDPVYKLLEHFFGVRRHNRDLCTLLDGNYSLFFHSEDINGSVVRGALSFACNEMTQAFEVNELQASRRPRRVERWKGYYFGRRERIVVVLRGEGRILRDTPKFYVLNTPHADEGELVTEIGGTMLKLGSGGTNTGAFSAKVLLRRDPAAFDQCDVLPERQIDPDVLLEI